MRDIARQTPLFALEAVAFDTETTGLDPSSARLIEMAAVRLHQGALTSETITHLVAPGIPIPARSTAIHGIRDRDLDGAGGFADVFPDVAAFIGDRPVVGHTIGFDLAIIRRECALAGLAAPTLLTLDTRLLAEIVAPSLADWSLDSLASWLGIEPSGRHRALADAALTGEVFLRLVPRLRGAGIVTLADAEAACKRLTRVLEAHRAAGYVEPGADLPEAERFDPERRLDSYPYRHRVRDVMRVPPLFVRGGSTLREALAKIVEARTSSAFVGEPTSSVSSVGIVTERDILRTIHAHGGSALDSSTSSVATLSLISVAEDDFIYRAIGRMARFNIRHLAVTDAEERVSGAVSARDLLRLRSGTAIMLGDELDQAQDPPALARAWARVPVMAAGLLVESVAGRDIAAIIARELGAMARRAAEIAIEALNEEGGGGPPCAFAFLVLGSAGRGESLLALDQDHAVVFESGDPGGPEDRWFQKFGERVAETLDTVGVPLCNGGVMASNPAFRGSRATWRQRTAGWINRAKPEDLLNADIFFDFRPVLGDRRLAGELWRDSWQAARSSPPFLRLLADADRAASPPIGVLGGLKTTDGRVDLKSYGLRPIVQSARLLALRHGVAVRSTAERLEGVRGLNVGGAHDLAAALDAHEHCLSLVLRAQLADLKSGRRASNAVPLALIKRFGGVTQLKHDLRTAFTLHQLALDELGPS
jgi:CBS domain-containing protein